jgi:hypothetical protein
VRLTFVCAFLQLLVVAGLLDNVEDFGGESLIGDGPGCGWVVGHFARCLVAMFLRCKIRDVGKISDFVECVAKGSLRWLALCLSG